MKAWQAFFYFFEDKPDEKDVGSQNETPEKQTRHDRARMRSRFSCGNNAVTFSWQTQQKPTPPRAPHDGGLPSQQREHPRKQAAGVDRPRLQELTYWLQLSACLWPWRSRW